MATDAFGVVMLAVVVGNIVLGLVIGWQAYRGFLRHESRAMRFLSIGLILLTAVASSLAFGSWVLITWGYVPADLGWPLTLVYRLFQFAGLSFITYSLYIRS